MGRRRTTAACLRRAGTTRSTRGCARIDNELVSDLRTQDVFGVEREREEGRCAYLLFCRRVR
ncbi:hypothetical protein DFH09DRAFT_1217916 [Mycena vulgaris]|nr:hypothetical protein DFH09DRAFT_1217916 [Mycena vulgaris]